MSMGFLSSFSHQVKVEYRCRTRRARMALQSVTYNLIKKQKKTSLVFTSLSLTCNFHFRGTTAVTARAFALTEPSNAAPARSHTRHISRRLALSSAPTAAVFKPNTRRRAFSSFFPPAPMKNSPLGTTGAHFTKLQETPCKNGPKIMPKLPYQPAEGGPHVSQVDVRPGAIPDAAPRGVGEEAAVDLKGGGG